MTYEEAIKIMKAYIDFDEAYVGEYEVEKLAIQAMELQVAKKPIHGKCDLSKCSDVTVELFIDSYNCPTCGGYLADELNMKLHNNCKHCGQKLNWGEV